MQDKNLHIDKSFTDKAWKEMQSMLDQEMPVAKKKRRFLIWWYTGGLALAASLFGIWLSASSPKETQVQESILSATQSPSISDQEASFVLTEKETDLNESNQTLLNSTPQINTPQPIQNSKVKPFQSNSTPSIELENAASEEFAKISETLPIAVEEETIAKRIPTPNTLAINDLNTFANPISANPIVPIDKINKNSIQLITEVSANFTSKSSAGGLGASMLIKIPIKKSKFSVETGLGYSYLSQSLAYSVELSQNDNSTETVEAITDIAYGNSNILKNTTSFEYNSISLPTERLNLHYLQLPVSISYRLKRFRFHTGLQASLLLTAIAIL